MMFVMVLLAMEVFLIGNNFVGMLDFLMTLQIREMISKTENDYQNWNWQNRNCSEPGLGRTETLGLSVRDWSKLELARTETSQNQES